MYVCLFVDLYLAKPALRRGSSLFPRSTSSSTRSRSSFLCSLSLSLSRSPARSRDATRHNLRSQINNAAVLLVPSRPCTRHYRRWSSPVAVYYGPGTLSVAWNAGSLLHGFWSRIFQFAICRLLLLWGLERWVPSGRIGSGILEFTNCCLLQSPRTLSVAWNAGSLLDGFDPESS